MSEKTDAIKKDTEENKKGKIKLSRRNFFKAAGATTAIGAIAGTSLVCPSPALAAYDQPASAGINMSVKYLDTPPYDLPPYADGSKLKRYSATRNAFQNKDLHNQHFGGQYWVYPYLERRKEKCAQGVPGFSIRDLAFGSAVEKSSGNKLLMDWGTGYQNMFVEAAGKWEDTPENNSRTVKKFAYFAGAGATGICEMKEKWFYTHDQDKEIIVSDEFTEPEITENEAHIPKSMKYAIAMVIPIDGSVSRFTPTRFGSAPDNLGYSQMSELTSKVAEFIRQLGYKAIPMGNEWALSIPIAIDAGLGELGRHGLLINPEFGSNIKICKVITDMPLAVDKPISFGAAEFCRTCKKCAEACPSKSISMETDPSYDTACPSNNEGAKRWTINSWTCLQFWVENGGGCYICQRNCTYSKQQTWIHDLVKVTASKTNMFNSIFAKMDDAFGYGRTWESFSKKDIDAWWNDENIRMLNWTKNKF